MMFLIELAPVIVLTEAAKERNKNKCYVILIITIILYKAESDICYVFRIDVVIYGQF